MTKEIKPIETETKPEATTEEFAGIDIDKEVKEEAAGPVDPMADLPEEVRKKLEKKTVTGATTKKSKLRGKKKKKGERRVTVGKAFIHSSYNNTIVTITDLDGNAIAWSSAGIAGFKGPKKSTPYAASIITKIAVLKAKEFGLTEVSVFVKGVGTGRESAIRALNANGLEITFIKDITPIPHNGCRRKKPRRV
jgi:small subunit ribosomal protein S11